MTSRLQTILARGGYLAVLALLTVDLLIVGSWYYRREQRQLREIAKNELAAVAKSKMDQIAGWRAERVGDAQVVTDDPVFAAQMERWLRSQSIEDAQPILSRLRALQQSFRYEDVALVDVQGRKVLSVSGDMSAPVDSEAKALQVAMRDDQAVFSDFYRHRLDTVVHTAVAAPIRFKEGGAGSLLGALLLIINADHFLYPLIQSWPTTSPSAEILLVERQGDQVRFLNELRHRKGTALALTAPLAQADLPAVMAVTGQEGLVEGVDYRGIPVVAYLGQVADSPLFFVAKIDAREAYARLRSESMMMLVVMAVSVGMMLILGLLFWQRAKFRMSYAAARERERMEREIRERDESHQLELQAKEQLLSHVSHELRTPLAVIHQFTTILDDGLAGPTTGDQQRYLKIILSNVAQLQAMINDLLESVRTKTGKLVLNLEAVALEPLIMEVTKAYAQAAVAGELTLRAEVESGLPTIQADPRRVRQILGNLVDNGIKFTPVRGRLTVRAALDDALPGFVRVSVADTGAGIAVEEQSKVFERLYQVAGSSVTSRKGLGLGLHISQKLVELHGGRIWLESIPAQGATFHFTLPIQPTETDHAETPTAFGG